MDRLQYQLKNLCRHNKDGSYNTQRARFDILQQMADQLKKLGYRNLSAHSLKPKHVDALVKYWQSEKLNPGTIKNRMAHLRWWAEKVNKASVIARDNSHYGIANRCFVTTENKGQSLDSHKLTEVKDVYVRMSLQLQREFGLRREESIKFCPVWADKGGFIRLKDSWTKGGRYREVPIRTDAQREVLNQAKALAGQGSLIPAHLKYIQQLRIYEKQTASAGLHKMHGLRHEYAQQRYHELTGWVAPAAGGPKSNELTSEQRQADFKARLIISEELGHSREQISTVYLGR